MDMKILKRHNPSAHRNNALQLSQTIDLCCGDKSAAVICQFDLDVDTAAVASIDRISLGGTEYGFAAAISTTATNAVELLQEQINAAVHAAGYTGDGVLVEKSGTTLTITTALSQLDFDYVQSDATPFRATKCQAFGDFKNTSTDETKVNASVDDDEVVVVFGALQEVTNVNVSGTSVTTFNGAPTDGEVRTATTLADGASAELTIVLTYADGTTGTFTRTVTK